MNVHQRINLAIGSYCAGLLLPSNTGVVKTPLRIKSNGSAINICLLRMEKMRERFHQNKKVVTSNIQLTTLIALHLCKIHSVIL